MKVIIYTSRRRVTARLHDRRDDVHAPQEKEEGGDHPLLEQRLRDAAALASVARRRPARPAELAAEDRAAQRERAEAEDGADAEDRHRVAEVAGGDDEAALWVERGLVG